MKCSRFVFSYIYIRFVQKPSFFRKLKKVCHRPLRFNNNNISQASSQKHLGLMLDNRLKDNFRIFHLQLD